MKRIIVPFLLGAAAGGAGVWYGLQGPYELRIEKADARQAAGEVAEATDSALEETQRTAEAALEVLDLEADQIRRELAERGRVVRRAARDLGRSVGGAASDAATTAAIEAALIADPDLSPLAIDVATEDGRVTLSGAVDRPGLIGRAVLIAYETKGVREVVSTIQLSEPRD